VHSVYERYLSLLNVILGAIRCHCNAALRVTTTEPASPVYVPFSTNINCSFAD